MMQGMPDMDQPRKDPKQEELLKEEADLAKGAVMKAMLQPGTGDATPADGDLVILTTSFYATPDKGSADAPPTQQPFSHPRPYIIGKGDHRTLRGIELGLLGMQKGEVSKFKIHANYAFQHKDCQLEVPTDITIDAKKAIEADVKLLDFHPAKLSTDCGVDVPVFKVVKTAGEGWETPRQPFEIQVSVSGRWLADTGLLEQGSTLFDTVNDVHCDMGDGKLPLGVEEALDDMKRGETATVLCPVSTVCGGTALPTPPTTTDDDDIETTTLRGERWVEYTVTLHDFTQVRDLAGDGTAVKRILKKGTGEFPAECPLEDTNVTFHYRVRQAGTSTEWVYDSRGTDGTGDPIQIDTGFGYIPDALESGLRLMLRNEVALVNAEWKRAYKGRDDAPPGLAEGSNVEFEIELLDFVPEGNWTEMSVEEILGRGTVWKDQGNILFKRGQYDLAKTKYTKGLRYGGKNLGLDTDEQETMARTLRASLMLNIAACAQRQQEYGEAISWCDKALSDDPDLAKAFFRRGIARYHLNDYEEASLDFETAKELDPTTAEDVDREIKKMKAREKAGYAKQKAQMGGFFGSTVTKRS